MTRDAHGRPTGQAPVFTSDQVATPTHAERARTLVAGQSTGSLSTLAQSPAGYPYGSFITFALHGGEPIFLISAIAEHTRNMASDPRTSLLVHETGKADPLANGRVTLLGQAHKVARDDADYGALRDGYLSVHPGASYYVDYRDFDFWRLQLEAVRYIGGYGRMSWVAADEFRQAQPDPIASAATRILSHMNDDHADSLLLFAKVFTQASAPRKAVMTAVDRYGFEMTIEDEAGVGPARIAFEKPLERAEEARAAMVALVRKAESGA